MKHYSLLWICLSSCLLSCTDSKSESESEDGNDNPQEEYTYSGIGYVTGLEQPGADVLFTAEVPQTGNFTLVIRYRNTRAESATISLFINDILIKNQWTLDTSAKESQSSASTDSGAWHNAEQSISLRQGTNTIAIRHDATDNGLLELDYIEIKKKP